MREEKGEEVGEMKSLKNKDYLHPAVPDPGRRSFKYPDLCIKGKKNGKVYVYPETSPEKLHRDYLRDFSNCIYEVLWDGFHVIENGYDEDSEMRVHRKIGENPGLYENNEVKKQYERRKWK